MKTRSTSQLPEVNFSDQGDVRYLHLGTEWIEGSMLLDKPFDIELEYVQRMMVWLLFVDPATVAKRHAMQLGLGAASLTKYCHKKLRMKTTAIELNPQVVAACRLWFKLPADDTRLSVILGDAAEVAATDWRGAVDALQVDLYDHEAAAPVLDSEAFYSDCRKLLTEDGCMTVNLFAVRPATPRAWRRSRRPSAPVRSGHSNRRARATPSCWLCARPSSPTGPRLPNARKPLKLAGACPPANGCECLNL